MVSRSNLYDQTSQQNAFHPSMAWPSSIFPNLPISNLLHLPLNLHPQKHAPVRNPLLHPRPHRLVHLEPAPLPHSHGVLLRVAAEQPVPPRQRPALLHAQRLEPARRGARVEVRRVPAHPVHRRAHELARDAAAAELGRDGQAAELDVGFEAVVVGCGAVGVEGGCGSCVWVGGGSGGGGCLLYTSPSPRDS